MATRKTPVTILWMRRLNLSLLESLLPKIAIKAIITNITRAITRQIMPNINDGLRFGLAYLPEKQMVSNTTKEKPNSDKAISVALKFFSRENLATIMQNIEQRLNNNNKVSLFDSSDT